MTTPTNKYGFWKGKRLSAQHRLKLSQAKRGRHLSPNTEFKKGHRTWNTGTAICRIKNQYFYPIQCQQCLKTKMVENRRQQCCSMTCAAALRSTRYKGQRVGAQSSNWKGGRPLKDPQGYRLIYAPQHPHAHNGRYVFEHRYVMEQHLGRFLESHEDVHHLNGDKQDNRLKNLMVMTKSEHTRHHHLKR